MEGRKEGWKEGKERLGFLAAYSADKTQPFSEAKWGKDSVIISIVFFKRSSLCFVKHFTKHSLNITSKEFVRQNLSEIYKYYLLSHPNVSTSVILKIKRNITVSSITTYTQANCESLQHIQSPDEEC